MPWPHTTSCCHHHHSLLVCKDCVFNCCLGHTSFCAVIIMSLYWYVMIVYLTVALATHHFMLSSSLQSLLVCIFLSVLWVETNKLDPGQDFSTISRSTKFWSRSGILIWRVSRVIITHRCMHSCIHTCTHMHVHTHTRGELKVMYTFTLYHT